MLPSLGWCTTALKKGTIANATLGFMQELGAQKCAPPFSLKLEARLFIRCYSASGCPSAPDAGNDPLQ